MVFDPAVTTGISTIVRVISYYFNVTGVTSGWVLYNSMLRNSNEISYGMADRAMKWL